MEKLKIEVKLKLDIHIYEERVGVRLEAKDGMPKEVEKFLISCVPLHNPCYWKEICDGHTYYYSYSSSPLKEVLRELERDLEAINGEIANIEEYNDFLTDIEKDEKMDKLKIEVKIKLETSFNNLEWATVNLYIKNAMTKKAKNYLPHRYEKIKNKGHPHYSLNVPITDYPLKEVFAWIEHDVKLINAEIVNIEEYNNFKADIDKEAKNRKKKKKAENKKT